ncbi:hypothetical protein D3C76_1341240 [compost metagenome]
MLNFIARAKRFTFPRLSFKPIQILMRHEIVLRRIFRRPSRRFELARTGVAILCDRSDQPYQLRTHGQQRFAVFRGIATDQLVQVSDHCLVEPRTGCASGEAVTPCLGRQPPHQSVQHHHLRVAGLQAVALAKVTDPVETTGGEGVVDAVFEGVPETATLPQDLT